jgi:hypothetical protein
MVLVFILIVKTGYADVPNEITYTGRLKEYNQPVTGTRIMNFRIYDAAANGTNVWSDDGVSVNVQNGVFTYVFKPLSIDWRKSNYWIETTVSGKILSPREKLTAQIYALHCATAEDIEKSAGQNIHFAIGSSTQVIITSDGKMGIGTTSPGSTFEVAGGTVSAAMFTGSWDHSNQGYVRIGNLQLCWGAVQVCAVADGSTYTTPISYPIAFFQNPCTCTQFVGGVYGDHQQTNSAFCTLLTPNGFMLNTPTIAGWGNVTVNWFAIGIWQ